MNGRTKDPTREDVLDSFSVEPSHTSHNRETLDRICIDAAWQQHLPIETKSIKEKLNAPPSKMRYRFIYQAMLRGKDYRG